MSCDKNFPNLAQLKKVTIISRNDLERVQNSVNRKQNEKERIQKMQEERSNILTKSKEKSSQWSNTLINKQMNRIERMKRKESQEELQRQKMDREWEQELEKDKNDLLERARKDIFYQTDRVKNFHSGMKLSETYDERAKQIELNIVTKNRDPLPDGAFMNCGDREEREAKERKLKYLEAQQDILTKMEEKELYNSALRHEDILEGEALKNLAVQYELEETRKIDENLKRRSLIAAENQTQLEFNHALAEMNKSHRKEEELELRKYAVVKQKMMKMRNSQVEKIKNDKIDKLEAIKAKMSDKMKLVLEEENKRMDRAIQESEDKYNKKTEEEKQQKEEMLQSILLHIAEQKRQNDDKREAERQDNFLILNNAKEADKIYTQNNLRKAAFNFEKLKDINDFNLQMNEQRKSRERQEVKQDRNYVATVVSQCEKEEEQFQAYANEIIESKKAGGYNVFPMQQVVEEGSRTNDKPSQSKTNTYSRLGFVW